METDTVWKASVSLEDIKSTFLRNELPAFHNEVIRFFLFIKFELVGFSVHMRQWAYKEKNLLQEWVLRQVPKGLQEDKRE